MSDSHDSPLPPEAAGHYSSGYEADRLSAGSARLEFTRTQDILGRYLPRPPAAILDIGGGPGAYGHWLADQGYEVHLVDAIPLHVEQAKNREGSRIASATVGDARRLQREDDSVDAALLMGPLYHLTERSDRIRSLKEAARVLKRGAMLCAVGISRFASSMDGLRKGFLDDPSFQRIVEQDLRDGQHRNPGDHPFYFTTAFFHHPDELKTEVQESGLRYEVTLGIEGPGWLLQNFDHHWQDVARRGRLLDLLRRLEAEPSLVGVSAHIMAIARKPE